MKICTKCKQNKETNQFYININRKDGLRCHCIECSRRDRRIAKEERNRKKWGSEGVVNLEGEYWKDVIGHEGHYKISNLGRVRNVSLRRRVSQILTPNCKNIYATVVLAGYGERKNQKYYLHRLLAIHFIPNPNNLPVVHHIDHNINNNSLDNLMWVTGEDNTRYASKANRLIRKDLKSKIRKVRIKEIVPEYYTDINFNPKDEIWKYVDNFENLYKISNYGRIISYNKNKNGKFLKPKILICRTSKTPLLHGLSKNSKDKSITVHRLVATHFIPNPLSLPEINHIDGNKHNNHVSNLEWMTHKDNVQHAVDNNLTNKGEKSFLSKLTNDKVLEIRNLKENENLSYRKISILYGVKPNTIKSIILRKTWRHI